MAKLLSEFTAELRTRNISRPNLYYVEIVSPKMFVGNASKFSAVDLSLVSMWCAAAQTPQTTIFTKDDYLEAGVRRKFAYDQDIQSLPLTFYIDQGYKIKKFFDQWKYAVVPQRRNFRYPDEYTAEKLNLYILNQMDVPTYKYEFSKVFPKSISSTELSYQGGASISTFTVDFVFEEVYYTEIGDTGEDLVTSKPVASLGGIPPTSPNAETNQEFKSGNYGNYGGGGYAADYGGEGINGLE
jgi:hypothetical protein